MKTYTVIIRQMQHQVIELPDGVEFDEDTFWEDYYDLGVCDLDSQIVGVEEE